MRHRQAGFKLNRNPAHRKATLRNLAAGLIEHGQITTTVAKAKAVQPYVEKLITLARRGDLHARRLVVARLCDRIMADDEKQITRNRYGDLKKGPKLVRHLFEEVAPRFADRPGGYTRIVRLGKRRVGDAAELCILQFVGDEEGPEIGGRPSRRRRQADRRTAFAASLRKAQSGSDADKSEPAEEADAAVAVADAPDAAEDAHSSPQSSQNQPEDRDETGSQQQA